MRGKEKIGGIENVKEKYKFFLDFVWYVGKKGNWFIFLRLVLEIKVKG